MFLLIAFIAMLIGVNVLTKFKIIAVCFFFFTSSVGATVKSGDWNEFVAFQKDADIVRLIHLKYYGEIIEEYKVKTGNYPFMAEADVPLYVYFASPEQVQYTKNDPPYEHKKHSFKEFVQLLEKGLGRKIDEYYDPQNSPDFKPNFYIYMAFEGSYFFAVHQHQAQPFSKNAGKHYNKVEISNKPTEMNQAHSVSELFANKAFKKAMNNIILRPDFFKKIELKLIHVTKQ